MSPASRRPDSSHPADRVGARVADRVGARVGGRTGLGLVVILLGLLALVGCGGSTDSDSDESKAFTKQSAGEIVDDAKRAMRDLEFATMTGTIDSSGTTYTLDLSVSADGACQGDLGIGKGTMQLLSNSDGTWFKGDEPIWGTIAGANGPAAMAAAGDKWVQLPSSASGLSGLCDLAQLTESLGNSDDGTYALGGTSTVDGLPVIAVQNTEQESTAYIQTTSPHVIVQMVRPGTGGGTITFSDFDKPFTVTTPTDVFDLSDFTG